MVAWHGNIWDIGLEVADAVIDKEPGGRPSGEAFVRLASKQDAELALERSKNYMGSRYGPLYAGYHGQVKFGWSNHF